MSVDAVELDVSTVGGGPNHSGPSPGGSAGRRRVKSRAYTAEDEALTDIAKAEAEKAETKLAQRRQARAEARKIRMLELEKQQKEVDEKMDMEYKMQQEEKKTYRHRIMMLTKQAEMVVAAGSGSSGSRPSSRRGSTESVEHDLLKDAVADLEEKYKKSMMTNAQLDNEKSTLVYEVDCLKDVLADQEEHMMELSREARDKHRDLESKKRENVGLKREVDILREMVEQRDQLISEHGLLLVGGEQADGDSSKPVQPKVGTIVVVSPEAAELLEVVGDGPLDVRLKRFVEERKELLEQIRKLKIELEESKERAENAERRRANPITINGPDLDAHDLQREATKQVGEYKFKLQKAEQDITNLGGQVVRLEGQVRRYKTASEVAEKNEEELKLEKRKMSRELRILREKVEEVETSNTHLQKRLDKFIKRKPEH
ncbi:leucine-rich repeat flightless-interacting protein 2-like isoform X5 [Lytechinus variegatus]|uniref:leucine-rich repeat flightless-interacting protein 2-like isoform X5 n=1 Tax=Lytechinus variegatus TaxID=7654 RepID=UPI001BB14984|nr:leucine-rich repeat flightless-interacting protein 2-like isoform X5 [Lytechinus variegatus]